MMKMTTAAARRLLRKVNPAPGDAFAGAAHDASAQATLMAILGSGDGDIIDFGTSQGAGTSDGRWRGRRPPTRLRWRAAVPAAALTAALAATLAIVLLATGSLAPGNPAPGNSSRPGQAVSGALVELVANLTAHPLASQGDASAELRMLADVAAIQPAPAALGPVEYSKAESWGLDLGTTHYGLSYRSHQENLQEDWLGFDGASLEVRTWPGGKVPAGNIPVGRNGPNARGAAGFARWYDPAKLPTSESAMRQHLLGMQCQLFGDCSGDSASQVVTGAETLMGSEPLPPAARAAILRVLAATAASPGPGRAFYDLGSVSDRAGHQAVAIAYEYGNEVPTQGGAPGSSCTTTTSGGRTTTTCSASGSVSVSASGTPGSPSATPSGTSSGSSGSPPATPSGTSSGSSGSAAPGSVSASASGSSGSAAPGSVSASASGSSGSGSGLPPSFMESSLVVLVFDPGTGALLGEEYAYCNAPVGPHLVTGKCFGTSYDQFLEITAVQSIPATPTAGPSTGTP